MKFLFFAQLILLSSCFEFDTMVSKSKEFYTNFLQKEFNITNSVILYISIALLFIIAVVFFKFAFRKKITYEDDNEDEESAPLKVKKIKEKLLSTTYSTSLFLYLFWNLSISFYIISLLKNNLRW